MREPADGRRGGSGTATAQPYEGITTLESLRVHLQWAIELEHATLPIYLCALYSLDPSRNPEAAEVVHSVFLEEMLHLALAANLLNAVGGRPVLDDPGLLPPYPRLLPHSDPPIELSLLPFGRDAVELVLAIERPRTRAVPPHPDRYETIGQFYEAIRCGFLELAARLDPDELFCGELSRQVRDQRFRGGPGRIFEVHDLEDALAALRLIVEQGEGVAYVEVWDRDHDMFHPQQDAVAHYDRFEQLLAGRRYRRGDTLRNKEQLGQAIQTMFELKARADAVMTMPTYDGTGVAGPTFEYVEPGNRRTGARR